MAVVNVGTIGHVCGSAGKSGHFIAVPPALALISSPGLQPQLSPWIPSSKASLLAEEAERVSGEEIVSQELLTTKTGSTCIVHCEPRKRLNWVIPCVTLDPAMPKAPASFDERNKII